MPIYEYECRSCQKITEVKQSLSDPPLSTCEICGGEVSKIISQSSFRLKGGGWFADGYSNSGPGCATDKCPATSPSSPPAGGTTPTPPCAGSCNCP